MITGLDAAHLFRWSTLTFLRNHWKLRIFVSLCYEFKISVALEMGLLYSQTFKNRFCAVLMDISNPSGKSRIVTCRFYKQSIPPFAYCSHRSLTCWDALCHHYRGCLSILEISVPFSKMPDFYYAVPPSKFFASLWRHIIYFKVYSLTGGRTVILKGEWYNRTACLPIALFMSYLPISVAGIQAATKVVIWKLTPQIYQLHYEDSSSFRNVVSM